MVSAMTVVPKNGATPLQIEEISSLVIKQPSIVHLNITKEQIANIELIDNGYVLTLADGRKVTISPIENSEIALTNPNGGFDKVVVTEVEGKTVIDYKGVTEEEKDDENNSELLPLFWWIGGTLGAIAVGASLASDSGSNGSSNDQPEIPTVPVDPSPIDPVDPVDPTPIDPVDPIDPTPVDPTPVDPVDPTPVDPVDPTPVDPTPVDPIEPEPTDPTDPIDPTPIDPTPTDPEPTDPEPTDPEPTDPEPTVDSPFIEVISAIASKDVLDFRANSQKLTAHVGSGEILLKTNANTSVKLSFVDENNNSHEYTTTSDSNGLAKFIIESTVQDAVGGGSRNDVNVYSNVIADQHFFNGLTTGAKNIKVELIGVSGSSVTETITLNYDHFLKSYSNKAPSIQIEDPSSGHFAFSDLLFETTPNSTISVTLVRTGKTIELEAPNGLVQIGRTDLASWDQIYNDDQLIITAKAPNGETTTIHHTINVIGLDGYQYADQYTYNGYYLPKFTKNYDNNTIKLDVATAQTSTDKFVMHSNGKLVLDSQDAVVEADTIANAKVYLSWVDVDGQVRAIESKSDENGHVVFNVQSMIDVNQNKVDNMLDSTSPTGLSLYGQNNSIVNSVDIIKGLTNDVLASLTVVDPKTNESRTIDLNMETALYVEQFDPASNNASTYFEGEGAFSMVSKPSNTLPFEKSDTDLFFQATNNATVYLTHLATGETVSSVASNGLVTFSQFDFNVDIKTGDQFSFYADYKGSKTAPQTITTDSPYYDNNVIFDILSSINEAGLIAEPLVVNDFDPSASLFDISSLLDQSAIEEPIENILGFKQIDLNNAEVTIDRDGSGSKFEPELLLILSNTASPFEIDQNSFIY